MSMGLPGQTQGCVTTPVHRCAYPAPYPEIRVAGPNSDYAHLLLEDYSGKVSEFSAIAQYQYHNFVLHGENREVADLLACVSLVEMHHLEILAQIILLLGVDPCYRTVNNVESYWDASYIFYGTSLCDRILADIASEWAAISNYRGHRKLIGDPFIGEMLERIILDELHHISLFNQVAQKYCLPQLPQQPTTQKDSSL